MSFSRPLLLAASVFGLSSITGAGDLVTSDLPATSQKSSPSMIPGGVMASASASGFASGNGNGIGQTMSKAQAQVQIGGQPVRTAPLPSKAMPKVSSALPISDTEPANGPGFNRRVVASSNSEDKITTGADDTYSTVIKIKPSGHITMIVVTMATMDVRRVQAPNLVELQKKDKLAYTEYLKYTAAE